MDKYFITYHDDGTLPDEADDVFVFGSNMAGVHGAGAAKVAHERYGALFGYGEGRQGQSYAIPTQSRSIITLPLLVIRQAIDDFIEYARQHPKEQFFVTRIGCGMAGYKDEQIAPLFMLVPNNCSFAHEWQPYLSDIRI